MLVELFYLPYHHGALAQELLEHFRWLRANSLSVGVPATAPDACGVRLLLVLLQEGDCHTLGVPRRADSGCVPRARGGEAGLSPSSCSALGRAACTAAWSARPAGRCSTTCTPTSGTSVTCCWPPVPSSSGWVRGGWCQPCQPLPAPSHLSKPNQCLATLVHNWCLLSGDPLLSQEGGEGVWDPPQRSGGVQLVVPGSLLGAHLPLTAFLLLPRVLCSPPGLLCRWSPAL